MPIQSGDIVQLASEVMDDVPEGGGGPSSTVIPWGQSNGVFDDITEVDRSGGDVSIRQLFSAVRTTGVERFLDAHIIVSHPPTDPNVSITLARCAMFDTRTQIAQAIGDYLIPSVEWSGYLLENHVAGQRNIQILHRPGTPKPNDNYTLLLIHDEGKVTETKQYVRVMSSETTQRTFTIQTSSGFVDFQASVTECKLQDALRLPFKGSPPDRTFARASTGTMIRDTTVADAVNFFGASTLSAAASLRDTVVRVASIYTQIVPNSRTETVALDQKPAAQRLLTLASSPRQVDVGVTPHSQRFRVTQETRSYSWTAMLRPPPAAGTIVVSYMAQGNWYSVADDGAGLFAGSGVGTVNYLTGSMSVTLPVLPDVGSSIIINWGEKSAYTNRSGQAGYRAPEFAWTMPHSGIKPGSVVVTWQSGAVLKTATDNGSGGFTGDASGEIDYASGKIYLRPTAMIDAGGEFLTSYQYASVRTENFNSPAVDAGGFGSLTLADTPAPNSITVRWITVRNVSASSGTSEIVSSSGTEAVTPQVRVSGGNANGNHIVANTNYAPPGSTISLRAGSDAPLTHGIYTWEASAPSVPDASVVFGVASGTVELITPGVYSTNEATFSLTVDASCPDLYFTLRLKSPGGDVIAESQSVKVGPAIASVESPWVEPPELPVVTREPVGTGDTVTGSSKLLPQMFPAGDRLSKVGEPQYPNPVRMYVRVDPEAMPSGFLAGIGAYDAPDLNRPLPIVWTEAEVEAKQKQMVSKTGVLKTYQIWGESYV